MVFELLLLFYEKNVFELYIFVEILEYYYDKYYNIYVVNLNNLILGIEFEGKSFEEIVKSFFGGIFNNVVQVWNYIFYWNCLSLNGGGQFIGVLVDVINVVFGFFDKFKEEFIKIFVGIFGFGWGWLVKKVDGFLVLVSIIGVGNLLISGDILLLICDVWEYVYYIDYCNLCLKYVEVFWNLVNWDFVVKNFVV